MTSEHKCSHVDHYLSTHGGQRTADTPYHGKANVFVSHAWANPFLDLVEALEVWLRRSRISELECYFWIDLFIVNQHDTEQRPFEWWETLFRQSMCDIGRALVVLNPWNNPVYVSRAWCLYEFSTIIECGIPYEIILSSSQWALLLAHLAQCDDSWGAGKDMAMQAITHIDIGKATASKKEDLENIMAIVKKTVGIAKLNQEIVRTLQRWMVGIGLAQIDKLTPDEQAKNHKTCIALLILYNFSCGMLIMKKSFLILVLTMSICLFIWASRIRPR
jgi:hypothetical protein